MTQIGESMYLWAKELFPITRSITGTGVRETLTYLSNLLPELTVHEVASGTPAFDWSVPDEWTIRDAYIADESGKRVVDFQQHNMHVVGYSEPVDIWLDRDELDKYFYSDPAQPDAIPYITSYYKRRWGFCLTHKQRAALPAGNYHAVIDSDLKPGVLNYGELILPGREEKEILLSTYICHPSMANNELSGPVVTAALGQWLSNLKDRRYTYRILFIPETIGSIVYLSRHMDEMKRKTVAGFVVTCVGDDRAYSFLPSRLGGTLADHVAEYALNRYVGNFARYSFLDRGSDERQYCSPAIDLPVVSVMRSKYGTYPEYHTSLDDLSLISPQGLEGGYEILRKCLAILEHNYHYQVTVHCEPQLGKRGLYPSLSTSSSYDQQISCMSDLLAYMDGITDMLKISEIIGRDFFDCVEIAQRLEHHGLLSRVTKKVNMPE